MRKLFCFLLITISSFSLCSLDVNSNANLEHFNQTHFVIQTLVDFESKTYTTQTKITFRIIKESDYLVLDATNMIINGVYTEDATQLPFEHTYVNEILGYKLKIKGLSALCAKKSNFTIIILHTSTNNPALPSGIFWLEKEATHDKKFPFTFTQCGIALTRTVFPCQDTPSVKATYDLYITVDSEYNSVASGLFVKSQIPKTLAFLRSPKTTYHFVQKNPVPIYLTAWAVGSLAQQEIGENITIYAEPGLIGKAKDKFKDLPNYLSNLESYIGKYEWTTYSLIVLPQGFPFSGMENPNLTFITASLISGTNSSVNVVIHEMSHSWSGNTVTCKTWSDFWLNEGMTEFIERKGLEISLNQNEAELNAENGWYSLVSGIDSIQDKELTKLNPNMAGRDPDDNVSIVPYEKGYLFLVFLERLVGKDNFKQFLRSWMKKFHFKSASSEDFKQLFIEFVTNNYKEKANEVLSQVDWNFWFNGTGYEGIHQDLVNSLIHEIKTVISNLKDETQIEKSLDTYSKWSNEAKYYFFQHYPGPYSSNLMNKLKQQFDENDENDLVKLGWYLMSFKNDFFEILSEVENYLATRGSIKYVVPIYRVLHSKLPEKSVEIYENSKSNYHTLTRRRIESILYN